MGFPDAGVAEDADTGHGAEGYDGGRRPCDRRGVRTFGVRAKPYVERTPNVDRTPRIGLAIGLLALTAIVACSSSNKPSPPAAGPVRVVRAADAWKVRETVDPAPPSAAEPSLDWYAEYVNGAQLLRLSGHDVSTAALQQELKGFTFAPAAGPRWPAVASKPAGPSEPAILILAVAADYSVMALSYELSTADLVQWSRALERR